MKFLIIGESCLDSYHYGKCTRLTPEAPVPVFNSTSVSNNGGMAMNVYNNIKVFTEHVDIHTNANWEKIKKTRFVEENSNHMFLRLDENDNNYGKIDLSNIDFALYDAVVVSDYNKGYLTEKDLLYISTSHKNVFLDTKKTLGEWCKNFSYIKINWNEYAKTKHTVDKDIKDIVIVTQGSKGCFYKSKTYPVSLVEVKDVSGAGDTFLACFSYKFTITNDFDESIKFANQCSTKVVQKRGVTTV